MEKYEIEVKETLSRIVTVDARNLSDAIDLVEEQYRNEDIVLNENDLVDTDFTQTEDDRKNKQRHRKVKDLGLR